MPDCLRHLTPYSQLIDSSSNTRHWTGPHDHFESVAISVQIQNWRFPGHSGCDIYVLAILFSINKFTDLLSRENGAREAAQLGFWACLAVVSEH